MEKTKKIAFGIFAMTCVIGLFLGPAAWYSSASFYSQLRKLEASGNSAKAIVDNKTESPGYRTTYVTIDIHFTDDQNNLVSRENIELNHLYYEDLEVGQSIPILYEGNEVALLDDYRSENVPLIRKPYWGMIYTLISYGFIIGMVIRNRRRQENKV
jgi:hypothetical protein